MMTFDRVLSTLVYVCESDPGFAAIERACAVRDLQGRVRLILAPSRGQSGTDVDNLAHSLESALRRELSGYFATPILLWTSQGDQGRLAREILDHSEPWNDASYEDPTTGQRRSPVPRRWHRLERRISKQFWLERTTPQTPWPLVNGPPPIVTFYSFKGGVGRTTSLVSCAWQLARERGKRVALIDLDLEAPGLGALLGAESERGVLDAIVDHMAMGEVSLDGLHAPAQALGLEDGSLIDVFPAGRLDVSYLEKLSRLDFASTGPWDDGSTNPVAIALRALLEQIRRQIQPHMIFLDARAGLHDLAGLSLHGLAHVDVLVSRASEQAFQGLDLTVHALSLRKRVDELRCVVTHNFAPRDLDSEEGRAEVEEFQRRSFEIFDRYIYASYEEDAPSPDDSTAAHWPWPLRANPSLERFTNILSAKDILFAEEYRSLRKRIEELCTPEAAEDQDQS